MKSIVNKVIYSLGGAFNIIGKELGHIYKMVSYAIAIITGKSMSINNTANAPMRITLNPTALSQTTYTGKNLLNVPSSYTFKRLLDKPLSLEAGTYIFSYASRVTEGDKNSFLRFTYNDSTYLDMYVDSSTTSYTITLAKPVVSYNLYSQDSYNNSTINVTFTNLMISTNGGEYEPYVGETASPNPSYPQDIHTISGNNSVVVEGKNLIGQDNISSLSTATGTYNGNTMTFVSTATYKKVEWFIPVKVGDKFTFSCGGNDTLYLGLFEYSQISTSSDYRLRAIAWDIQITTNGQVKKFTIQNDGYLRVYIGSQPTGTYTISNIQLERGEIDSPVYTPYVSQTAPINLGEYELGTIGNYSNEFVRSGGENLAYTKDGTYTKENNTAIISNSLITLNTSSSTGSNSYFSFGNGYAQTWAPTDAQMPSINDLKLTGDGGNYIATMYTNKIISGGSVSIRFYTSNNRELLTRIDSATTSTLNIPLEDGEHIKDFGVWSGTSTTFNDYQIRIMLNKGTTALPYVPYEKGWYYKQSNGKFVLDGTEASWVKEDTYQGISQFSVLASDVLYTNDTIVRTLSNYFKGIPYRNSWQVDYSITSSYTNHLRIMTSDYSTLADFKTWLSTHNTIVYYVLATPTYTKITGELASQLEQVYKGMLSYDGTTNISQVNNDLAFELSVDIMKQI